VFLRDVGQVHDGWAVQQNVVRNDGRRSVLLSVLKNGNASTVAVVNGVRKVLEVARAAAPPGLSINELFDQSKLVTADRRQVRRAIAGGLTGLMSRYFSGPGGQP
jgi:multidrug efflux pump subunit AcrB